MVTLETPHLRLTAARPRRLPSWLRRLIIPVLVLAVWEAVVQLDVVSRTVLAPPSRLPGTAWELLSDGTLQEAVAISFGRALLGLAIGSVVGAALAIVAGLTKAGQDMIDPVVQMLRPIPATAILPLIVLFMGLDEAPKIFLVAYACFFPVFLNLFQGIRDVDQKLVETASVFGLDRRRLITTVILPSATSSFFVGFRFSVSISWIVLVVAEQLNAQSGVGYLMVDAQRYFRPDVILVGIIVYAVFGIVSDTLVRLVERRALRWRNSFQGA